MNNETVTPFWTIPPYILLTDVLQLDKVEPWNVNVGTLVAGFLNEMKKIGEVDFRISGNALYSASVIFMRKTRDLVDLGVLPPDQNDDEELVIPLIRPPFRITNQRVTLQELLVAMDHVLRKGVRKRPIPTKQKYRSKAEPLYFTVEAERANIEETIADVYRDLQGIMEIGETAKFLDTLMNTSRKEIVRVFFSMLHLYARALIDIWMDDDQVIWVKLLAPQDSFDEMAPESEAQPKIRM